MSFLVYFFVLLVAASSVLFGLDWMQAPLQAPPRAERTMHVAPAPPQKTAETPARAAATQPAVASAPAAAASADATPVADVPASAAAADAVSATETTGTTDATAQAKEPVASKPPLCDIAACESAYHTFSAADCTYQPYDGPRRLCTKGTLPAGHAALLAANESRAQAHCNVSACESAYTSFDAATCTYQPYDGRRRLCTK